jgi:hypothetical protein
MFSQSFVYLLWRTGLLESFLLVNKNEIMAFVGKWVELEIIMLNGVSQAQKTKYLMLIYEI